MRRLEPVLALMKDAVHRYDGIVNKIQGDGVMALFGAPRPHEDHGRSRLPRRFAMQDAVARLDDASLQIRVGIHTGEVVVQTIENSIYQTTTRPAPTSIWQIAWSRWRMRVAS